MALVSIRGTKAALLGLAVAVLPPLTGTEAATTTAVMPVSATVLASCTLTAQPLVFGNYQGTQLDASTTLGVTCTNGTVFNIGLDTGSNQLSGARRMAGPQAGQYLSYNLTRDAAHTLTWGSTVGTNTLETTSTGVSANVPVYGRIAAGQYPQPGAYTDSVTVTVTY